MALHEIVRDPYGILFKEQAAFKDVYGGETGTVFLECLRIRPRDRESKTVIVFSHPTGRGAWLPICTALAHAGFHVAFVGTRYAGSDHALIMEKCVVDLGEGIADLKKRFGYDQVILGGWSGGGSLSLYYQEQALRPTVTATPAGDPPDLTRATLPPADAVLLLAAHVSRSVTLTEWLDPSITDETQPFKRDPAYDLYADPPAHRAPYAQHFLVLFRAAQVARNRRITAWAEEQLAERVAADGPGAELGFVVHGTMADPRWLDPAVDPNDRAPGTCYLGDPKVVNMGPVGLARFTTLRSWLSQWSFDRSMANGLRNAVHVGVPVLVVSNTADNACTPSHASRLYTAVGHGDKTLVEVKGATHYYAGQPQHLSQCVATCADWLAQRGFETIRLKGSLLP
ncbi:MAG: alpha/beta hydrolase [Alphaproteobacteria bacterium]